MLNTTTHDLIFPTIQEHFLSLCFQLTDSSTILLGYTIYIQYIYLSSKVLSFCKYLSFLPYTPRVLCVHTLYRYTLTHCPKKGFLGSYYLITIS